MKRFNVLVPTDFSEGAELALEHGLFLTKKFEGDLHLLHVAEMPTITIPDFPTEVFDMAREEGLKEIKKALSVFDDLPPIRRVVLAGIPSRPAAEVILDYAREAEVDFIVMGTHGRRGPRRFFMGSVTEEVVRRAPCPVLTIKGYENSSPLPQINRIVVPVDFSERSKQVVGVASMMADHYGASIALVHVVDMAFYPFYGFSSDPMQTIEDRIVEESEAKLAQLVGDIRRSGVRADWHTLIGHPARAVAEFVDEKSADLIVMGSHGRSGYERVVLGSISEKVLRTAHCPVLIVNTSDDVAQIGVAA